MISVVVQNPESAVLHFSSIQRVWAIINTRPCPKQARGQAACDPFPSSPASGQLEGALPFFVVTGLRREPISIRSSCQERTTRTTGGVKERAPPPFTRVVHFLNNHQRLPPPPFILRDLSGPKTTGFTFPILLAWGFLAQIRFRSVSSRLDLRLLHLLAPEDRPSRWQEQLGHPPSVPPTWTMFRDNPPTSRALQPFQPFGCSSSSSLHSGMHSSSLTSLPSVIALPQHSTLHLLAHRALPRHQPQNSMWRTAPSPQSHFGKAVLDHITLPT